MKKLLIILLLGVGACSTATHYGDRNVLVECNDLSACIKRLADECPNGFDIVGRESSVRPVYAYGTMGQIERNNVIAQCR